MEQVAHGVEQAVGDFLGIDLELAVGDGHLDALDFLGVEDLVVAAHRIGHGLALRGQPHAVGLRLGRRRRCCGLVGATRGIRLRGCRLEAGVALERIVDFHSIILLGSKLQAPGSA